MAFADQQLGLLEGKLSEKHVKTRVQRGMTLSYIEGWYAIAEANRIFGFDGWDREMVAAECVWQNGRGATRLCACTARVRIRVRAGNTIIQRDGSGVGQKSGATMGEAHESALKEAETDATKRALTTFGNLFGLALYDRKQAGVRRMPRARDHSALVDATEPWVLLGSRGEILSQHDTAESYCAALKRAVDAAVLPRALKSLCYYNEPTTQRVRLAWPELKTSKGVHYADLLERYTDRARQRLSNKAASPEPELIPPAPVDKSTLLIAAPKRLRDSEHLRFINTRPCLICGRAPVHAHHLRFAQLRSMGNKVSDEWAVPLCFTHHRALHTVGDEEAWWAEKGIDAKAEAIRLWRRSHGIAEATEAEDAEGGRDAQLGPKAHRMVMATMGEVQGQAPTGNAPRGSATGDDSRTRSDSRCGAGVADELPVAAVAVGDDPRNERAEGPRAVASAISAEPIRAAVD